MKCPYQTKVIHKPEYTEGYVKNFAEDITEFCECVKSECPFYYTSWAHKTVEHCRKAESEEQMKLIIDINEEEYKEVLKDTYSGTPFENKIFTAIANGTPIDNATNGDIIKTLYPNREFINKGDVYWYPLDYLFHEFSPSWWDSPYSPNKTEEEEA